MIQLFLFKSFFMCYHVYMFKKTEVFPRAGRVIYMKNESGYGRIEIKEAIENHELVRLLLVDEVRESAAFMEDDRHFDLVFKYTRDFAIALHRRPEIQSTLLLGGAGFSFPKYYIHYFPEKHLDVVEINPNMFKLAMEYFYLDELYEKYDLNNNRRMEVFLEDANDYIRHTKRTYDLIINDAYVSNRMDDDLLKARQVSQIKKLLNPGGIYVINLITAIHGPASMPGILEYEIMKNNFKNTDMFACKKEAGALERQNVILVGTDGQW